MTLESRTEVDTQNNLSMKNFNNDRGGNRFSGARGPRREMTMHKAVCSNCGKSCEVPFKPVNGKPVYCKECFGKMGGGAPGDRSGDRNERPPRRDFGGYNNRNERSERPERAMPASDGNDDIKKQLQSVNIKLDRLIAVAENLLKVGPKQEEVRVRPAAEKESLKKAVIKATAKKSKKK
jgi:CxxC-x17-CxxC domain-containing protein